MTRTSAGDKTAQAKGKPSPEPRGGIRRASLLGWFRLARTFQLIDRRTAAHLKAFDLTVAQFDVLAQVGAAEGMTQQKLADALLVTKGNVAQLLDRMESRNLIERRPAGFGRANLVYLTTNGRALHRKTVPAQEDLIDRCFCALTKDEQEQLARLLRKLEQSLS